MTKKEIIYSIFEKLNINSDDSDITGEFVSSLIDTKRAMLLKQQYAKNAWQIPIELKQELCLDLEIVNKISGYSCAGKILSTSIPLPKSIKVKGKEGPLLVRKLDGTEVSVTIVSVERLPYLFENKFTQHLTYCAVDFDRKLYLISNSQSLMFLKSIKVTGIFEDPEEARKSVCNVDTSIEADDDEYPIEIAMLDVIIQLIVKDLTRSLTVPSDHKNDSEDGRG
jgi:hypothetical protein